MHSVKVLKPVLPAFIASCILMHICFYLKMRNKTALLGWTYIDTAGSNTQVFRIVRHLLMCPSSSTSCCLLFIREMCRCVCLSCPTHLFFCCPFPFPHSSLSLSHLSGPGRASQLKSWWSSNPASFGRSPRGNKSIRRRVRWLTSAFLSSSGCSMCKHGLTCLSSGSVATAWQGVIFSILCIQFTFRHRYFYLCSCLRHKA